jgi:uncharacterized coiled-coil protein SlyX
MAMQMADDAAMTAPGMPGGDSGSRLYIQFFTQAVQDEEASVVEGRPVYNEEEFITIIIPGDRDSVVRPVRNKDRQDFSRQYQAFKANQEQPVIGTPLSVLPFLTKAQVAEFNAVNVRTAEQLRDMNDAVAQKYMGIQLLRKQVKDFLEAAAGAAPTVRLNAELAQRDKEIESLKKALADQGKKIEELQRRK